MRHYEIVFLVHPDQSDEAGAMAERYRSMVTEAGGAVHRFEDWGRRQLAYPIDDFHKAHYVLLNIECGLETLREIEDAFKFSDAILRSLILRRDSAETETSLIAIEMTKEAEREATRKEREKVRQDAKAEGTTRDETIRGRADEAKAEPATEAKAETDAEPAAEAKAEADAEPAAEAKAETDAEPAEADAEPATPAAETPPPSDSAAPDTDTDTTDTTPTPATDSDGGTPEDKQ